MIWKRVMMPGVNASGAWPEWIASLNPVAATEKQAGSIRAPIAAFARIALRLAALHAGVMATGAVLCCRRS